MIDDPEKAYDLLLIYNKFIVTPGCDMRSNSRNYFFERNKASK